MDIKIEKIIYTAKSLARIDGKVILTDEGIPGETVSAAILKEKKNLTECMTEKVLSASPKRRVPRCGHYMDCSPYQYIDYPEQLRIKKEQINEIFSKVADTIKGPIEFKASPVIWNYRNKIRLHLVWAHDTANYAYRSAGTKDKFATLSSCWLARENINNIMPPILEIINKYRLTFIKEITFRENSSKEQILVWLHGDRLKEPIKKLNILAESKISPAPSGIIYTDILGKTALIKGSPMVHEVICGKSFYAGYSSFCQVNIPALELLVNDLKAMLPFTDSGILADFYSGIGTFGISLADRASASIFVESMPENTGFLKNNIMLNNIKNYSILKGDCQNHIEPVLSKNPDIFIVDPPRNGLSKINCASLCSRPPKKLVYISCDPMTLARDIGLLKNKFYAEKIIGYDFFPHTYHFETLCLLTRID